MKRSIPAVARDHPNYADELEAVRPALEMLGQLSRAGDSALSGVALGAAQGASGEPLGELGDFRLIREVGRGGMGVVYEAEQMSLRRRVALKVLPWAAAMDPKQLQRFKNEALAAASLQHDHIVPVYAVGCERGVHYYAMEFVDGQTLADVIRRRASRRQPDVDGPASMTCEYHVGLTPRRSPDTAPVAALSTKLTGPDREGYRAIATLIADAADALEHAHTLGIIHRDVKPGNLLLDNAGKVYVSDFGLARFGPDAGLTMSGDLLGTLRYMAPEQALARHGLADHRVDVYGLGCTLYELLTGKPAVDGTDKADILRRLAFEEPVAPRKLDKAIPSELETIALKCLAKNPNERYLSAGELAADLRRFCEDKAIKARPATRLQKVRRWGRRHRHVVWAASLSGVVALAALAGSIGWIARERAERRVNAARRAGDLLQESERFYGEGNLPEALSAAKKAEFVLAADGAGEEILEHAQRTVDDVRSDGSLAPVHDNVAMRMLHEGDLDRAEAAERQAIRIRPNWGWAYRHLGFILSNKGDSDGRSPPTAERSVWTRALPQKRRALGKF